MKKEEVKLYCPKTQGTFRMMFGFKQTYMYANKRQSSGLIEVFIDVKEKFQK
jgi:hypothetical protein